METGIANRMKTVVFFFNDTATTEIYTLSLHDALPISSGPLNGAMTPTTSAGTRRVMLSWDGWLASSSPWGRDGSRSEEHTSELQSRQYFVCRLLLEKITSISSPPTTPTCSYSFHSFTQ